MIRYFVFGLSLSLALVSNLGAAHSQTTTAEPDSPYQSNKEQDAFSSGFGGGFSAFDLMHQIQSSPSQSLEEFREKQQRNLDSAASEFRQQQEQLLQEQSSQTRNNWPATDK